ncbi:hypothetical protein BN946_scf184687.g2 [Trametes cinnabarina]|uniref:Uncharacterized protein n=1 Tax=Pycnoporus cinnabarinus TaxID=5643 RepID=A0A060S5K1_PYCCI|nr:hypothetical protein BN946_scf184687.g2 [Trametes cinnabarina]
MSPSQTCDHAGRGGSAPPTMSNLGVDRHVPRPRDDSQLIAKLGMFIDHTANTARLDVKHRGFLHEFKEYVMDMPPTHWRAIIHLQATALRTAQAVEKLTGEVEQVKTDIDDVATQSSKTFLMTPDHNATIRKLCKRLIIEPSRVDYENLADNARDVLKETYPEFEPAFQAERSKSHVMAACRSSANYVRNSYRKALKESLFNPQGRCGLTKFVKSLISKFDPERKVTPDFVLRVAVLRRFCLENPAALDCDDLPAWVPPEHMASLHPVEAPKTGKRKREGGPFWEQAQEYIEHKIRENGEDLNSEKWRSYLSETIRQEQKLFPDDRLPLLPQVAPLPPVTFSAPDDLTVPTFGSPDDMFDAITTTAPTQVRGMENEAGPNDHVRSLSRSLTSSPFSPSVSRMSPALHPSGSPRTPAPTSSQLPTSSSVPSASLLPQSSGPIARPSIHLPRLSELAPPPGSNGLQLYSDNPDTTATNATRLASRQPSTRLNVASSSVTASPDWFASTSASRSVSLSQVTEPDAHVFNFDLNARSSLSQGSRRPW